MSDIVEMQTMVVLLILNSLKSLQLFYFTCVDYIKLIWEIPETKNKPEL